jgi:hypothetical protein
MATEYKIRTLEELRATAEALDCELYMGAPNLLLLDLDTPEQVCQYAQVSEMIGGRFEFQTHDSWMSRNSTPRAPRQHIVIKINQELDVPSRLALQDALGSDPKRTAIAIWEWIVSKSDTISLFKPKVKP